MVERTRPDSRGVWAIPLANRELTKFPEEAVGTSPALAIKSLAEAGLDGELKSWEETCFEYMEEQADTA